MLIGWYKKFFFYRALRSVASLQRTFFLCYFEEEVDREKKIHQQRKKVSLALQKNPELTPLVDSVFSLHQLRHRFKDAALLEACSRELKALNKTSIDFLLGGKSYAKNFSDKINDVESLYNNTLRVVLPDPAIFLFFIQDLYAFQEEVEKLYAKKTG